VKPHKFMTVSLYPTTILRNGGRGQFRHFQDYSQGIVVRSLHTTVWADTSEVASQMKIKNCAHTLPLLEPADLAVFSRLYRIYQVEYQPHDCSIPMHSSRNTTTKKSQQLQIFMTGFGNLILQKCIRTNSNFALYK
jgi:hypothetical protein